MIEYVRGILDEVTPTTATVECGGVGYMLNISLNTYSAIQGKGEVRLYVHEAIREDAWTLFGFATKDERALFLLLIGVSGIGGNTARTILSAYSPSELCGIIQDGNDKMLKTVKGLGLKTAQRIIVELKDKVSTLGISSTSLSTGDTASAPVNTEVYNEAVEALKMLGYPPAPASKAVKSILKEQPDARVEQVIKMGLRMLSGK